MSDLILSIKDVCLDNTGKESGAVTLQEAVVNILRESLRLEVDENTHSEYTGGLNGQPLYEDRKSIKVTLWADIDEQSYKIDEIDFEA
ncbi:hypothetical protein CPTMiller_00131 [Citrobacter phage Miller]|uniref:Uncharacterized protein n=2 Tax=Pseudotevenvirus miller TaxID=2843956 RepID=A0A1B1IXS2_9CAUD|nr:hypothetical protein CPTMiller_00131 [Citrobacter phage Miller]YP_009285666.1 hypothetical protein BI032_gp221 [Citrobacter phage vB_CfrM_CfP1]AIK68067.1 hypothetical protein CPTMiller_00131 [Citrobacter phage Miller]ANS06129.1 hypothetical protein ABCD_0128 [Citrobacter phage vB_CfrM_CfP1]QPX73013.1 hypothetical protein [Citrobacter phage vB_Cfr_Xman]